MAKETNDDADLVLIGLALKALRDARGITQSEAAARSVPSVTSQYWGMYERGLVKKLRSPALQRRLLAAIDASYEDLQQAMAELQAEGADSPTPSRLKAIAGGLSDQPSQRQTAVKQAVFQLSEGQASITYPSNLSAAGFQELAAYLSLFLKTAGKDTAALTN